MPEIIPIRDLKNTTAISELCKKSTEPVFVTKNGYGDMVIMSMDAYEEKLALLDIYEKLDAAEEDYRVGRVMDAHASMTALRAKYGI